MSRRLLFSAMAAAALFNARAGAQDAAPAPRAAARDAVHLRTVDGKTLSGEIRETQAEGILFAPADGSDPFRLSWNEIQPDDAERLRPGPAAPPAGPEWVSLRFIDGSQRRGLLVGQDDLGILFRHTEESPAVRFTWAEIDPEYVRILRSRVTASVTPASAYASAEAGEFTLPGEIVTLQSGQVIRGKPMPEASTKEYLILKTSSGPDPIKVDRAAIMKMEPANLRITEVYTVREAYQQLMERQFPKTGEDHLKMGDLLVRAGLPDLALLHYRIGQALNRPETQVGRVYHELARFRERVEDLALQSKIWNIQQAAFDEEYDAAAARIAELRVAMAKDPKAASFMPDLDAIAQNLSGLKARSVEQRMLEDWEATTDSLLMQKASDRSVGFLAAVQYVSGPLPEDILNRVAQRYQVDRETVKKAWETRPRTRAMQLSYDNATWLAEAPDSPDKTDLWEKASPRARYQFLRGRYVEQHLETVQVGHKDCPECGGSGETRAIVPSKEKSCTSCRGTGKVRFVFYR